MGRQPVVEGAFTVRSRQGRAWWAATAPARPACCGCSAAVQPKAGVVHITGGLGYLRRTPASTPPTSTCRASTTLGPGPTSPGCSRESCAWPSRRTRPSETWPASAVRRTPTAWRAATRPSLRPARSPPAWASRTSAPGPAHRRAVRWRAPAGRARLHPFRRQRRAAARRAHEPPGQRRPRLDARSSGQGGSAGGEPRPELLDEAITRAAPRPAGRTPSARWSSTRAPTAVPRRGRRDEERLAWSPPARRPRSTASRRWRTSMRHSTAARAARPRPRQPGQRMERERVEGPSRKQKLNLRFPELPKAGRTARSPSPAGQAYGDLQVFDDRRSTRSGRAPAGHGPQRRGQDQPAAGAGRGDDARRRAR